MSTVKGFVIINDLINNDKNTLSPVGEMSSHARSYSPDNREYSSSTYPNLRLALMSTLDDNGEQMDVGNEVGNVLLNLIDYIDTKARNGELTSNNAVLNQFISNDYPSIAVGLFVSGAMVASDAGYYYPSYINWTANGTTFTLWFSNRTFIRQYDEYTLIPIKPVEELNDLHRPYTEISDVLTEDLPRMLGMANEISQEAPYTALTPFEVTWNDKHSSTTKKLTWYVVQYGVAGNNPDAIAAAIAKSILEDSDYDSVEWYDVFPTLFRPTEFIIVPMWHRVAIEEQTGLAGTYSPTVNYQEAMGLSLPALANYPLEHVDVNLTVSHAAYKTIAFTAVGEIGNSDGIFRFEEKFPDYTALSAQETDFNRLSPETQDWVILFHRMLTAAETVNEFTQLDTDISRITRDGVDFLIATYKDVNYLVVQKQSFKEYYNEQLDQS
tara:strand:- start:6162 stop:7478 length:1317 start_codon:yes stop_codon:yes gene_type:complete